MSETDIQRQASCEWKKAMQATLPILLYRPQPSPRLLLASVYCAILPSKTFLPHWITRQQALRPISISIGEAVSECPSCPAYTIVAVGNQKQAVAYSTWPEERIIHDIHDDGEEDATNLFLLRSRRAALSLSLYQFVKDIDWCTMLVLKPFSLVYCSAWVLTPWRLACRNTTLGPAPSSWP